jgi:Family of unknown function (DUF6893)
MKLLVLLIVILGGAFVLKSELPAIQRYLKIERM